MIAAHIWLRRQRAGGPARDQDAHQSATRLHRLWSVGTAAAQVFGRFEGPPQEDDREVLGCGVPRILQGRRGQEPRQFLWQVRGRSGGRAPDDPETRVGGIRPAGRGVRIRADTVGIGGSRGQAPSFN